MDARRGAGKGIVGRVGEDIVSRAGWLAACAALAVACAAREGPDRAPPAARLESAPTGVSQRGLVVRLAFGEDVDLDLYVTDPLEETLYFANTPSRIGGRLEADVRCDAGPGPRVETVVIDPAPPGRYRVGVDFPERCDGGRRDAAYRVRLDGPSGRQERSGRIAPGVFEPIVLEIVQPDPAN